MRLWVVFLLTHPLVSCAAIPVGVGDRMHICGSIVDGELKPVLDTLTITTRVSHPVLTGKGDVLESESRTSVTDGKFCVDAYNALGFNSTVRGQWVRGLPISGTYQSVNVKDFKWVVERIPRVGKRPNFDELNPLMAGRALSIGHSTYSGTILYYPDSTHFSGVNPLQIRNIVLHHPSEGHELDTSGIIGKWNSRRPNTMEIRRGRDGKPQWILRDLEAITDFRLKESGDDLFIIPGPLVRTKFIPASLDSPICNFGRMPGPPPGDDPRWTDSLHVAIRNALRMDGFWVYSPEHQRWGKIMLKPEVIRDTNGVQLQFAQVIKPVSDTGSFFFWRIDDSGFQDDPKCLTPAESYRAKPEYKGQWDRQ